MEALYAVNSPPVVSFNKGIPKGPKGSGDLVSRVISSEATVVHLLRTLVSRLYNKVLADGVLSILASLLTTMLTRSLDPLSKS